MVLSTTAAGTINQTARGSESFLTSSPSEAAQQLSRVETIPVVLSHELFFDEELLPTPLPLSATCRIPHPGALP